MHDHPLVSVILIFLNAEKYIQEAIDSVLVQTYECWELLLIDDGSTDRSTEIAQKYVAEYPKRLRYLEHPDHQNLGMSAARNLGIQNTKGEFIAFLDSDDYWLPNRLESHVGVLDAFSDVGMLYGSAKYWYSWTGHPQDRARDFVPELRVRKNTLFQGPELLPLLLDGKAEVPCTCSILVRREIMQKIGGFEESFRGMYEDQALYAKICLYAPVLATDDCLAWYRQHSNSNYSNAIHSGQTHVLRYRFLKWLETYCHEKRVQDKRVWVAVRRQLWLYDSGSRQKVPGLAQNSIRWIKKWILRVEEQVLPSTLRDWLWIRK